MHLGRRLRLAFGLLCGLLLAGCAASTQLTNDDIRLYTNAVQVPSSRAVADSLVCVSYNIAFAAELDLALGDLRKHEISLFADILFLQEMNATGAAYLAAELGLNYYYFPSYISPHHGDLFGNAVLSPWPLTNAKSIVLPHPNPLTEDRRAALAVDVTMGDRTVQAISVHLATLVVELENRVEQAEVIRDSLVAPTGPVVVAGDFNSGNDYESMRFRRVFRKKSFREARLGLDRTAQAGPLDLVGYHLKLDHIYYRNMAYVHAGGLLETEASDHFPIWAILQFLDR
ncbi:MAG: endonuclease/exonuclease/phosphatase family metal-dependent hydrolase [Candidatus Krumholzibacteriia bacterium]